MLYRFIRSISIRLISILAVFAILLPATAQGREVFTVRGVAVDAHAADELTAKSAGIARAQHDALRQLLQRITLRDDHDRLPEAGQDSLPQLLRDYSVDEEKFGGGHYLAKLTVRFKPDAVRQLLRTAEIPFAETVSRPVLVLPVFQTAGATSLWDEPNPWFAAWTRLDLKDRLLPLRIPVGDLSDVAAIGAEQAVRGDPDSLARIAAKYEARTVLVATATLRVNPGTGATTLSVAVTDLQADSSAQTRSRKFEAPPGTARDDLILDAARSIADESVERWKRANLLEQDTEQRMQVRIPLNGFQEWLKFRRRIQDIAGVQRVDVAQLSIDRAEVDISYIGNPGQLRLAMAQNGLQLNYVAESAVWMLRFDEGR